MKKRHSGPQIVAKLRQTDVLIGHGETVPEVCREIEVSEQTYYRWRQKYGGMSPDMIKQFRALQKENARLKKVVADQALDNAILKEAAEGNFSARPGGGSWWIRRVGSWAYQSVGHAVVWVSPAAASGMN